MLALKEQPRGLFPLTLTEFWDRFSYYGIQALLILYLTNFFLFTDNKSYSLYGVFTALTFASTVLGGIVADRWLGLKQAIFIGSLLMIVGNLALSVSTEFCMYLGL